MIVPSARRRCTDPIRLVVPSHVIVTFAHHGEETNGIQVTTSSNSVGSVVPAVECFTGILVISQVILGKNCAVVMLDFGQLSRSLAEAVLSR